jgi:dienelactone hydrolase
MVREIAKTMLKGKNQNSKPLQRVQKRISLALDQLIRAGANSDNIVVGYCFGGTGRLKPHVDI